MNAPSFFARFSLAALAATLCSCVYTNTDPGYGSYGYGGPTRVSSGYGYGNYGLPWGVGGGGYRSGYGYCDICHSNPCRCGRRGTQYYRDDHDHDHHDHDRDDSKRRDDAYRIAGGSVGSSKTKPTGYHSPEWYKSKGYNTSHLRLENEDGEVYRSSSSRSSSSSSHSSRDRDDDHRSSSSSSRSSSSGSSHHKSDDRNHNNPRFEQRSGGGGGSSSSRSGGGDGDSRKRH
jgi:hypothetical protein